MVVICPKCKARLKIDDSKVASQGSRFKCPKCGAVLAVKKPVRHEKKALDSNKVLVAHSNPETLQRIVSLLAARGYCVIQAADGIDVMVKGLKEYPFLVIIEVALPKIYGFEVCKRLKMRAETKEMKFILIPSIYDRTKYRREPVSLYGADDFVEDHDISTQLIDKVEGLKELRSEEGPGEPCRPAAETAGVNNPETKSEEAAAVPFSPSISGTGDEKIERAKRLARTIINDIYLYNASKLDEAVRNDNFYAVFTSEITEGKKLYDNRIAPEVRNMGDFFKEAIENFISSRKKILF